MTMGLDPQKMAAMQNVSSYIKAVIRNDYTAKTTSITYSTENEEAAALIPQLIEQLSTALATQLSSFFGITGEIVEVQKKD